MNRRRVAVQLISTGGIYGAERVLLELAAYLHEQGWESYVVALEGRGAAGLVREASAQGLAAQAFVEEGRMAFLPMLLRLRCLLAEHRQAIIHSHGYKPDLLLRLLNVPRRLACVATCHSAYSEKMKLRMLETAANRALRTFDHAVAVSEEIRTELLNSGMSPDRVTVISNGISELQADSSAREKVRSEFNLPAQCRLIVQIGRLVPCKRIDLTIAAMMQLRCAAEVHLLLVGEGEQRKPLEEQISGSALAGRVRFCGYRRDVPRLLAAADAFVLSSDSEGLPVAILEAMMVRCPIVTTSVGAIPGVLAAGKDAWIVPPGDVTALAAAIDETLGNPALARERAESAHQRFELEYSRDAMGRRYLRIYENVWIGRGWH